MVSKPHSLGGNKSIAYFTVNVSSLSWLSSVLWIIINFTQNALKSQINTIHNKLQIAYILNNINAWLKKMYIPTVPLVKYLPVKKMVMYTVPTLSYVILGNFTASLSFLAAPIWSIFLLMK